MNDPLIDAFQTVFGERTQDPLAALRDMYGEQMETYLSLGEYDALVMALRDATGLPVPREGDPVLFFLSSGSFGDRPVRATIVNGELHFIYDDEKVQMRAAVNSSGELVIGYDDTQLDNFHRHEEDLYYDYLGS
jgi:hypothetical protein